MKYILRVAVAKVIMSSIFPYQFQSAWYQELVNPVIQLVKNKLLKDSTI